MTFNTSPSLRKPVAERGEVPALRLAGSEHGGLPVSVTQSLYSAADRRAGQAALIHQGRSLTFAELLDRIERLAAGLASRGLGRRDRVAILLPNSPAFVTSFFAITGLRAVVVALNPAFKEAELEFYFRESGVGAVITDAAGADAAARVVSRLDTDVPIIATEDAGRGVESFESLISDQPPLRLEQPSADEDAVFQYSPGSTGRPKRVPRTHGQLWLEADSLASTLRMTAEDRILCAVPLFHAYGLGCCLLAAARSGAALVMHDDRQPFVFGRERMLELLEREAVTVFPGVPFMFRLLAETPGRADLSRLRLCLSAANPLPWSTFQAFNRRFGIPVRQLYGTTETGALTANLDRDAEGTAMSVGRPIRRVEVKIVDETGAPQQEGRIGEIAVSSPAMTRGYAGLPDVNRHAFADGYFRTGDRGRIDNDGRLFLTGRKKLLIDVKGDKVDPIEVEDVLAVHPKVREVVVVGVSSGVDGEDLVKAVVVPERACEDRELIRFCRERLANFKVPRTVEFRDEIPRSAFGRVLRGLLADPDGSDASQVNHSTALSVDRA